MTTPKLGGLAVSLIETVTEVSPFLYHMKQIWRHFCTHAATSIYFIMVDISVTLTTLAPDLDTCFLHVQKNRNIFYC